MSSVTTIKIGTYPVFTGARDHLIVIHDGSASDQEQFKEDARETVTLRRQWDADASRTP